MKKLLFILFCLLNQNSFSQFNLVPNYSFEIDADSCVIEFDSLIQWYNPTNASPDYFHECFPSVYFLQPPRTGIGYAGIILFEDFPSPPTPNYREYIATPLISALVANKKYCVEFYVSLENWSLYSTSNIGLYLSADSVFSNNKINLPYQPQIINSPSNIIEDSVNWVSISNEFVAQGGEKYIVIGNFYNDLNTILDTITQQDTTNYQAYYAIDDVSVTFCDSCTKPAAKFNYTKNDLTATFNNLTTDSATNWFWDFGDGSSTSSLPNPVHVYDSAGTYTVTFVACNFICCDTMVGQVSVSVGVDELQNADYRLQIYPNPADEEVTITAKGGEEIIITDLTGRKIKEYKNSLNQLKINTDEYDNGIYFLCLYSDGRIAAREKMVIVR